MFAHIEKLYKWFNIFSGGSKIFLKQGSVKKSHNLHREAIYMSHIHVQLLIQQSAHLSHSLFTSSCIALSKATQNWI